MKPIFALALLAVLGFAAAGCASGKKIVVTPKPQTVVYVGPVSGSGVTQSSANSALRVPDSTTVKITNVKTGTRIRCKGWQGKDLRVPRRGSDLDVGESVKLSKTEAKLLGTETELMSLTHRENGAITVACELVEPR